MKTLSYTLIFILIIAYGNKVTYSQEQGTCKVLLKEISGTYKGDCKDGLANGKGTATGEDKYTGQFKNGLPDGKGKYSYKNGNSFKGTWVNGLKEGRGTYIYYVDGKINMMEGYWKNDEYVGPDDPDLFYRVTNQSGISHYTIKKVEGKMDKVTITFIAAMTSYVPSDLKVNVSTGKLGREAKNVAISQYSLPMHCEVHYSFLSSGGIWQCFFYFDILKPGSYEIVLNND